VVITALGAALAVGQQDAKLTPKTLERLLAAKPTGGEAQALAGRIRQLFGEGPLKNGPAPKVEELTAAFALEAPGAAAAPEVITADGQPVLTLQRLGDTDVYAAVKSFPDGTAFRWRFKVGDRKFGGGEFEAYKAHPDSLPNPSVPKGQLKQMPKWESTVFAGTVRDWWVYVPAQYKDDRPACVMVFQDGGGYKDFVPTVFDNLIAKGEMPVTVGIFIQPGTFKDGRSNRSFEYDTLSDQYARFLLEEILPDAEKTTRLRHDPAGRAIAGLSSGGICAFTVAWERPNEFGRVLSWIGSFTNIASGKTLREGGHNYPALIRKTSKKPIKVFLQDGAQDLDNVHGNWPLANQEMAKALAFKGYDYQFVYGQGFHSNKHGRAILPDSLRWLWKDEAKPTGS
jgi:enterochelin esterase family protein